MDLFASQGHLVLLVNVFDELGRCSSLEKVLGLVFLLFQKSFLQPLYFSLELFDFLLLFGNIFGVGHSTRV